MQVLAIVPHLDVGRLVVIVIVVVVLVPAITQQPVQNQLLHEQAPQQRFLDRRGVLVLFLGVRQDHVRQQAGIILAFSSERRRDTRRVHRADNADRLLSDGRALPRRAVRLVCIPRSGGSSGVHAVVHFNRK